MSELNFVELTMFKVDLLPKPSLKYILIILRTGVIGHSLLKTIQQFYTGVM